MQTSRINPTVQEAINRVQNMAQTQSQVDFAIHTWRPFPNLSNDGLRFPAVPSAEIPRMELIPIVATKATIAFHTIGELNNRVQARQMEYVRPTSASMLDLISKYAAHSLVRVGDFFSTTGDIEKAYAVFDLLFSGMPSGLDARTANCEQLANFFELPLPYELPQTYQGRTATEWVDTLYSRLATSEWNSMIALKDAFVSSLDVTILMGVGLGGRLPSAISSINSQVKDRFDGTESWLAKQFPHFDTASRISVGNKGNGNNSNDDAINKLAAAILALQSGDKKKVSALLEESEEDEVDMESKKFTDNLPAEARPENWDALTDSEQYSRAQAHLNKLNNMTIQPEDVVGMTAAELNRVQQNTNDAIVTREGVITEDQVAAALGAGEVPEVTDFQKAQQTAGTPAAGGKVKPTDKLDDSLEARGQEARGVDPVNALRDDLTVDIDATVSPAAREEAAKAAQKAIDASASKDAKGQTEKQTTESQKAKTPAETREALKSKTTDTKSTK